MDDIKIRYLFNYAQILLGCLDSCSKDKEEFFFSKLLKISEAIDIELSLNFEVNV